MQKASPRRIQTFVTLLPSADQIKEEIKMARNHTIAADDAQKVNQELSFHIALHGILLWASTAFLLPVGILISRVSKSVRSVKVHKVLFLIHVIFQTSSVIVATTGAILALVFLENSFNNSHQRLGLGLYALIWTQPLVGICRPRRGKKGRCIWYFGHWFLGTTASIVAIVNVYIGLQAYHAKTSRSTRLWTLLFTLQVVLIALIYLLQDRWSYIKNQGILLNKDQIAPTTQQTPSPDVDAPKRTTLAMML